MQLLLGRQQFFVRRLVFLADGRGLLLDRLLLFTGKVEIADRVLQFGFCRLEFLLKRRRPRCLAAPLRPCRRDMAGGLLDEADQKQILALALDRSRFNREQQWRIARTQTSSRDDDAAFLLAGGADRRPQFDPHAIARHREHIMNGVARRQPQISVGWAKRKKAFVLSIDENGGGRIGIHHHAPTQIGQRSGTRDRQSRAVEARRRLGYAASDEMRA